VLYSIVGTDVENSLQARLAARPEHVERLKQLASQGRLVLAGPNPAIDSSDPGDAGFTGSFIIAGTLRRKILPQAAKLSIEQ